MLWQDEFMSAWIWFSGAVLLSIAEVLGAEFVLLMLGGGALITAGFAVFFPELLWLQLIVFALSSVALVLGLRPMLLRKYYQPANIRSGIEAIIGSKATVVSTVDADGGQVKIGGEVWTARAYMEDDVIEPGRRVQVLQIEGATALVSDAIE